MRVFSSLDQPFDAEIELIDVGSISLAEIRARLAEPEDYQRVGLDRSFSPNTLRGTVERKPNSRTVIHMRSKERVSEPFFQLLIDLAWSKGQLFREYDVLLDPPDYQLPLKQRHLYHRAHVASTHKPESTLADIASSNNRQATERDDSVFLLTSGIKSVPTQNSYLAASQNVPTTQREHDSHLVEVGTAFKAQIDMTAQAIESVRETNVLLKKQLHLLTEQNKKLQTQLTPRNKELKQIHSQIDLLMKQIAVAGQLSRSGSETDYDFWVWFLILVGILSAMGYLTWRKWGTPNFMTKFTFKHHANEPLLTPEVLKQEAYVVSSVIGIATGEQNTEEASVTTTVTNFSESAVTEKSNERMSAETLAPTGETEEIPYIIKPERVPDNLIEFTLTPLEPANSVKERGVEKPVKSKAALDTLLSIAATHIDMGDLVAAEESIHEVLRHGDEQQIAAAQALKTRLN